MSNKELDTAAERLNDEVHRLVRETLIEIQATGHPGAPVVDAVEAMLRVAHVMSMNYASVMAATISGLAAIRREDPRMPASKISGLLEEELGYMQEYVLRVVTEALEEEGSPDVMDPEALFREQLLMGEPYGNA